MILMSCDTATGELKIYSSATGGLVLEVDDYSEENVDQYIRVEQATRLAEKIARKQALLDMEKMIEKTRINGR